MTRVKLMLIVLTVGSVVFLAGCNSMGKIENADGSIEKIPQDVGVARAVADGIENCPASTVLRFKATAPNDCSKASGVADRAECFRSNADIATMDAFREMAGNNKKIPKSCAESVAGFGKSYMEKEAVQAKQIGSGSKFVAGSAAAYGMTKELVTGFVAGSAAGDTSIGSVNVNGSSGGAGTAEIPSTAGSTVMNTNIGAGNRIQQLDNAASNVTAEKFLENNVSGESTSDPLLDDSKDGGGEGNEVGINPF